MRHVILEASIHFFVYSIGRSGYSVFVVVVIRSLFFLGGGEGDRFSVRGMCVFICAQRR